MNGIGQDITAIAASVIGLAALAVIFSNQASTSSVISSAGTAYSGIIQAAVSPVTGGGFG